MINVHIGLDGVPSERKINLGNKYENKDEVIHFELPTDFDTYNKYVIGVIRVNGENITKVVPVTDNLMIVSTALTYYEGNWSLYLMCRENTLDLETDPVDISAKNNEHVFISDGFIGVVNKSNIEADMINNMPLDANLQPIYDELIKLKEELQGLVVGTTSWENILNKPQAFPPEVHDHNELYYTKSETNERLPEVVEESIVPKIKEEIIPEIVPDIVSEVVPEIALTQDDSITNEEIEMLFRQKGWRLS